MKEVHLYLFSGSIIFLYVLYFAVFFGILAIDQRYIRNFSTLIQFSVCLFLIYRFWPYSSSINRVLTQFDISLIFYCASFLLINVVATEVYMAFFKGTVIGDYVKDKIDAIPNISKNHTP